ncbi:MAG: T9SS type A sorting domain-containing protein [Candidatus Marinimicrobia bacterium]|jgi:hypothetical protein|nr:T9SS type A sorting domain-containing protein [Candidatus Neomarinimicrobiota bacterium]
MKIVYILLISTFIYSQVSKGGTPISFKESLSPAVELVTMEPFDIASMLEEDKTAGKDVPFRFGHGMEVMYDLLSSGTWETLPSGDQVWRLSVSSPGAYSINIIYDDFFMPPGGKFFVYSEDKSYVIGAFTEENNKEDGVFATQPVPGDRIILEYVEPAEVEGQGRIRLWRVIHAYRNLFGFKNTRDYGDSGTCNNNVNCPEGILWQDHNRAVAMILTSGGSRLCSGALVNNVRQDQTQYFLTADHCLGGNNTWIFMFNYESPTCANQNGPTNQTVQGSVLRASRSTSDFSLLELTETIPFTYNVNYAGWSAEDVAPQQPVGIHHPSGDIKKISFDYDAGVSDGWSGNDGSHWRVIEWDDGTTEPGSSGSPLFDNNYRIVGQLHGGQASCSFNFNDYYGKFSASWDWGGSSSNQLKDWLDPDNTGTLVLDSYETGSLAELTYSPGSMEFNLEQGETGTQSLTLTNTGEEESVLSYVTGVAPFSQVGGGPDSYGMTWSDSDIETNIDYGWIDISDTGLLISFNHNDNAEGPFEIGFDFPFYGQEYEQYIISPNGWIGFGNDNNEWDNSTIPSSSAPNPAIFGFWDDLNPVNDNCDEYCSGNVYTHSNVERLVVWFDEVAHWWNEYPDSYYDFQFVLYPSGTVQLNYRSIIGTHSATIGMQNSNGSTGLQVSFNNDYVHEDLSLLFSKGPEWLTVTPTEGEIDYGMSENATVTANTTGLDAGEFQGYVSIFSNGGAASIPVGLNVGSGTITITRDYAIDWNLVGLPLITDSNLYIDIFPHAITNTLFSFVSGSGYEQNEVMELGTGYWLRMSQDNSTSFTGDPVGQLTVSLVEGWNLISGITNSVSVESIIDPSGLIVPNTIYGYNQGYYLPENIEPGKAYWLRSFGDGTIVLSATTRETNKVFIVQEPAEANTLKIGGQKLYFGDKIEVENLLSFSLPPKPPAPSTDIRFSGDTKLCTSDECLIEVMNDGIPLTIECEIKDGETWEIVDESGNVFNCEGVQVLDFGGKSETFVLRKSTSPKIPTEFALHPAHPNPFNPLTVIQFSIAELSHVNLSIYDIKGRLVETLVNEKFLEGNHQIQWNASGFPSGIYFIQFSSGELIETQKIVLMR